LTIAGFYLSPEGIVFGADSTSSTPVESGLHYFDFNQKVFEIGTDNTLGMLTWGLGGLWPTSYRTLLALLGDNLAANPATSVMDVAQRWIDRFWSAYTANDLFKHFSQLHAKTAYNPAAAAPDPGARTKEEEDMYLNLHSGLRVGFCIGGYVMPNRVPQAAHMDFDPLAGKPVPTLWEKETTQWWGTPNIIDRLTRGADSNLVRDIMSSGKWDGTEADLLSVIADQRLRHGTLPIRDAIDYVHTCIQCTIKAMKFSNLSQICGGPIEIAVITTDRKFRWVRHKPWDAAITDGGL
jgi:hypothetical protein